MQIELSDDVLSAKSLIIILDFIKVCKGQHSLSLSKKDQIIAALKTNQHYLEYYKEMITKSANGFFFSNKVELVLSDAQENQINLDSLYDLLKKPAVLVLENEHSDHKFINMVLNTLGSKRLHECYGKFWEVRGNGGSGEIIKLVNKSHALLGASSRVCVVHDSDKLFAADNYGVTQVNIINRCKELGVTCITLKKREIENYVVDEVINSLSNCDEQVKSSFTSLKPIQKDFIDYKKGVNQENSNKYKGLFDNLEEKNFENLSNGLGKNIAEIAFDSKNLKFFTLETLNNRCNEILPEFRKIESNLLNIL